MFSLAAGKWTSPPTSGERPLPCAHFSLTMIDNRRAVLFGGREEKRRTNNVYILNLQSMVCQLYIVDTSSNMHHTEWQVQFCKLTLCHYTLTYYLFQSHPVRLFLMYSTWTKQNIDLGLDGNCSLKKTQRLILFLAALHQAIQVRRRPLASGKVRPCCLLHQLWRGAPSAAGQWWTGQ